MNFIETKIKGAYVIEMEYLRDERGFFARSFCSNEFTQHGLKESFQQCNISFNHKKGTIRGLHYQEFPFQETKLVRCTQGAIFDVIVDLRRDSSTFVEWYSIELTADNHKMLYIPEGIAHGFQTLSPNTEVFYQMGSDYHPESARGIRWDDPLINIKWPAKCSVISEKDKSYKNLNTF